MIPRHLKLPSTLLPRELPLSLKDEWLRDLLCHFSPDDRRRRDRHFSPVLSDVVPVCLVYPHTHTFRRMDPDRVHPGTLYHYCRLQTSEEVPRGSGSPLQSRESYQTFWTCSTGGREEGVEGGKRECGRRKDKESVRNVRGWCPGNVYEKETDLL